MKMQLMRESTEEWVAELRLHNQDQRMLRWKPRICPWTSKVFRMRRQKVQFEVHHEVPVNFIKKEKSTRPSDPAAPAMNRIGHVRRSIHKRGNRLSRKEKNPTRATGSNSHHQGVTPSSRSIATTTPSSTRTSISVQKETDPFDFSFRPHGINSRSYTFSYFSLSNCLKRFWTISKTLCSSITLKHF
jgi:hypothetical protein